MRQTNRFTANKGAEMDTVIFLVMAPFFLLLGLSWIARLVNAFDNKRMQRKARRDAERWSELCDEYEAQGMTWIEAMCKANEQISGK